MEGVAFIPDSPVQAPVLEAIPDTDEKCRTMAPKPREDLVRVQRKLGDQFGKCCPFLFGSLDKVEVSTA